MAFPIKSAKKSNPFLEKREEKVKKDLDGDGEKGEPKVHQMKVLGKKEIPSGGLKKSGKGEKRGKKGR